MDSRALRLLRWVLWLVCLLVGCYALWLMARSDYDDTFDRPIWTLIAADSAMAVVLYVSRDCLDPRRLPSRLSASVVPGAGALLLQLLVGFLMFPATLEEGTRPDRSWYGVVALVVLMLGFGALLLTALAFALVVAPLATVPLRTRDAVRGDDDARYVVLLSVVLLLTVTLATSVVTIDPVGGRSGILARSVLLLLGVNEPAEGRHAVAWLARAALLGLVGTLLAMTRVRRRIQAAGADPDTPPAQGARPLGWSRE